MARELDFKNGRAVPVRRCDLCGSDDFARRLMGYNLCSAHYRALDEERPDDMLAWLKERAES